MSNLISTSRNGSLANKRLDSNFRNFSSFLDDFFKNDIPSVFTPNFGEHRSVPFVNIKENDETFILELAAPGMNKNDFTVDLDDDILSISASRENHSNQESLFTRQEFEYSSFQRSFSLPDTIDQNKIKAEYKQGILEVLLPKKEEAKKQPARTIKIS